MYVYYERFPEEKDVNGVITSPQVTQVVLSSDGSTTRIDWKNQVEKAQMDILTSIFKQIPLAERDYNEPQKIWTFIGFRGDVVLQGIKSMITQGVLQRVEVKEIEELEDRVNAQDLRRIKKVAPGEKKYKDEDFFNSVVTTNEVSGIVLLEKLAPLLQVEVSYLQSESSDDVLKKLYRKAALRLHPDRNGGIATQMTELNYLWNIFMQKV